MLTRLGRLGRLTRGQGPVVAAIAAGGAVGACARYGAARLWPTAPAGFPWTTVTVNLTGCAAIGVLLVLLTEVLTAPPLVRPFAGTGVLGGYTTFSAYAVDVRHLATGGRPAAAAGLLVLTPVAALAAVWAAAAATRLLTRRGTA